ncbi:FxSxx-COOH system tetratricopeptide repeat protein [Micromonospora sp. NPDC005203]|uniref:FxSxx-COOH system tetratricopeptide repeat protein n=1 Tax=Micromonospora sp. NPDC005203 TaxID=3364226 RepID=UPI0036A61493
MSSERDGKIVTFYSFKGGTGRTMALANVAWILAANGKRVLVTDWDLESPGLHRFFHPFLEEATIGGTGGVIDLIREYELQTIRGPARPEGWVERCARVSLHAFSLRWEFPGGGGLDFLSAGRQDSYYATSLSGLDWDTFYNRLNGDRFFKALRADMKREYDYTLIDSRTGLSDVADICTLHLPDILVDCFTLSDQGIDGGARVARTAEHHRERDIRILPAPMRVDQAEKEKADAGRALAMRRFTGLPTGMTEEERRRYWAAVEVPYRPFYAYEETLATFGDDPGSPTSLLAAFERLTAELTDGEVSAMPPMDESVRERQKARFRRRSALPDDLLLRYAPEDAVWAEWIERALSSTGVRVVDGTQPADPGAKPPARTLTILSSAYVALPPAALPPRDPAAGTTPLAVYVSDLRPLAEFPVASSISLFNVSAEEAAERLFRLVDRPPPLRADDPADAGLRFPAAEPAVFEAPDRNARFTGREGELAYLRRHLTPAKPVALQGMDGVGKTELALEYVHRFKSAYDVVWWITIGATESAGADVAKSLAAFAARLGVGGHPDRADDVRAVREALGRGERWRWLLVIDNAEEVDPVEGFLPTGGGHVLLTSRSPTWAELATLVQVDVFARAKSVAHLRRRVPALSEEEAGRIADALGDLAVAVAAAGAYLADTGTSADAYLEQIEWHGPTALSVEATWNLSLARLRRQFPAAFRLLQLCSVLAPEIHTDLLLQSDEMAAALKPFDPEVSQRDVRGRLVQQMNRSALVTINTSEKRVLVHRLLQAAVRETMTVQELADARHQVHQVLAGARPKGDTDDPQTWDTFRMLWPHIEPSGVVSSQDESARELIIDRVRYLWRRGDLDQANAFAAEADEVWSAGLDRLQSTDEVATLLRQLLHLRFNRANVLRALARYDEALALDEQVLEEQRELLGERHPHTLMTAGSLGADLRAVGRYAKALEHDQKTYDAWSEEFGEQHPRTLNAGNNRAHSYRLVGDFRSARTGDDAVLVRRRLVHGPEHPYTLHSIAQLARDLREAGEYGKSATMLSDLRDQLTGLKEMGSEAGDTLNAQVSLAVSQRCAGQETQAAGLLDSAYPVLEAKFGRDNPETLICRAALVANLLALGKNERAVAEAEQVAMIYERWLGARHPHTLGALSNLAVAQRAMERAAQARATAERAASALREVLGPDHPHTLAAQENFGICLAEEGDRDAAIECLRATADRWDDKSGVSHPDALRCRANLDLVLRVSDGDRPSAATTDPVVKLGGVVAPDHPSVRALREGRLVARIIDPHPF